MHEGLTFARRDVAASHASPSGRPSRTSLAILLLAIAIFVGRSWLSLREDSAVWDETPHVGVGRYLLETGRWDVKGAILHPPLPFYLAAVPGLLEPFDAAFWNATRVPDGDLKALGESGIERGRVLLSDPGNAGDRRLHRSRLVMVGVAVLLAVGVWMWSFRLFGPSAAVLSLVLFTSCPNVIAHARLATPDIVLTTFFFLAVFGFWLLLRAPSALRAVGAGALLGLGILSKYTAVLLLPVLATLVLLWKIRRGPPPWRWLVLAVGVATAVILLAYRMNPEPFFQGIEFQRLHASDGHAAYLRGELSHRGWWYYLPLAVLVKTPLATLLLTGLALILLALRIRRGEDWTGEAFLLAPVVVLFGFFAVNHQSIGLRYVLPAYPFLHVLAGSVVPFLWATLARRLVLAGLVAWAAAASLSIHPHYLAYFNEVAGGPEHGHEWLVDSNLDWGQELVRLRKFMESNGIRSIHLSYFGTDRPARHGIEYDWLPSFALESLTPQRFVGVDVGDWVAISATNLKGVYFPDPGLYEPFRKVKPVAVIGHSLFIYRMPE